MPLLLETPLSTQFLILAEILIDQMNPVVKKLSQIYFDNHDPETERFVGTTIPMVTNNDFTLAGLIYASPVTDDPQVVNYNFIFSRRDVADIRIKFRQPGGENSYELDNVSIEFAEFVMRVDDFNIMKDAIDEMVTIVAGLSAFPPATTYTYPQPAV